MSVTDFVLGTKRRNPIVVGTTMVIDVVSYAIVGLVVSSWRQICGVLGVRVAVI